MSKKLFNSGGLLLLRRRLFLAVDQIRICHAELVQEGVQCPCQLNATVLTDQSRSCLNSKFAENIPPDCHLLRNTFLSSWLWLIA